MSGELDQTEGPDPTPASVPATQPAVANGPSPSKFKPRKDSTSDSKKRNSTFSVAEEDWENTIPSPGHYDAEIIRASINPKSDITYLTIEYQIVDQAGRPYSVIELAVLDAKRTSSRHAQSAQGKGRVKSIMEANGKPLTFSSIQAVPLELMGCRVRIAVGHKDIEGLPVPVVHGIVGPVTPERRET
jgi:hypothetical protein